MRFTSHNFVHIPQKYLKDPFCLCEVMVQSFRLVRLLIPFYNTGILAMLQKYKYECWFPTSPKEWAI